MFLLEKYQLLNANQLVYHRDIFSQLAFIASNENIPHIIISGPAGSGKKTLVRFFLEELYDPDVNIMSKKQYNINGSSTKKKIDILQSCYHIVIEPTNTNYDKYIIQEIVTQYTLHKSFNIFKTKRVFKTIVIYNIEKLSNNSQAALRRTMEIYAKTCRFIMVCNNISRIFDPLRSRCRVFCVPLPSINLIRSIIIHMTIMEQIYLSKNDMNNILDRCNCNIKKAIWLLELKRLNITSIITDDTIFDEIVSLILESKKTKKKDIIKVFDTNIRSNVYKILIADIKASELIITLMDKLIKLINNDYINIKIIHCASEAEYNLLHGRRDIVHIDYFICNVMKILRD